MTGSKKSKIYVAVGKTQRAYRDLKQVCPLS